LATQPTDTVPPVERASAASPERSELVALFAERAAPLGVDVDRVAGPAAAASRVAALAPELGVSRALVAAELAEVAPGLVGALNNAGVAWDLPGDPAATRDAPFGISLARLAVAETASVLLAEPTLSDRAIGMLAVVQLVVCPTAGLVPSLDEAAPVLRDLAARPGGAYATLVTGPSRTADIERVLTVGVQGPARLAVLFVDDLG
jgi:L-lactate dehydrogenase complex protein LldG